MRAIDTLAKHLPGDRVETAVKRLEDLEVGSTPVTAVKPGYRRLLDRLPGTRWAIVTSAGRRSASARWAGAGLPVPDVTFAADDIRRGKPDPKPFATAAERLGVAPERCLVFEDSAGGGLAARAVGAAVCAVGDQPWSFDPMARISDLRSVSVRVGSDAMAVTRLSYEWESGERSSGITMVVNSRRLLSGVD